MTAEKLLEIWEDSEWRETKWGWTRTPKDGRRSYPYAEIYDDGDGTYSTNVVVYNKRLYPGFVMSWGGGRYREVEDAKNQCNVAVQKSCTQLFTGVM